MMEKLQANTGFPETAARGEPPSPGSITAPTGAPKAGAKFAEFAFYEVE